MRHGVRGRKLGRTASHRLATLRALTTALLKHKKIKTTLAKAKTLRTFAEPLITKARIDSVENRRLVAKHINDKDVVKELFGEIVAKIGDRAGGYTRVVKLGNRLGDAAEMAIIELVDYNDLSTKKEKKSKAAVKGKVKEVEAEVVEAEVVEAEEVIAEADVQDAEVVEEVKLKEVEKAPEDTEAKSTEGKAKEVKSESDKEVKAKKKEKPKKAAAKPKKDKK
jgi:large subunit ribosomal protein L17